MSVHVSILECACVCFVRFFLCVQSVGGEQPWAAWALSTLPSWGRGIGAGGLSYLS